MANIINIETSARRCSVALGIEGQPEETFEENGSPNAAAKLAPFVETLLDTLARKELPLDAVAVSMGPGSYTGLRIGLSLAKGLCFSRNIPLIAIPTLELLAIRAMFSNRLFEGNEIFVPMIDARRMEVYTAAYDLRLQEVMAPRPMILTDESAAELIAMAGERPIYLIGDGSEKARKVIDLPADRWLSSDEPHASFMTIPAEKAWREGRFADTAYCTPIYLKEYEAKISVNKVLAQNSK